MAIAMDITFQLFGQFLCCGHLVSCDRLFKDLCCDLANVFPILLNIAPVRTVAWHKDLHTEILLIVSVLLLDITAHVAKCFLNGSMFQCEVRFESELESAVVPAA
jgi:hypothetical protein